MARYSLIMKDSTYVALLQEAAKKGKSLGKYLNEILNAKAAEITNKEKPLTQDSMNPHCMTCASFVARNKYCRVDGRQHSPRDTCLNFRRG